MYHKHRIFKSELNCFQKMDLTDFREGVELVHSGAYDFTGGIEVVTRVMDD